MFAVASSLVFFLGFARAELRSFWQVTDFHLDLNYTQIGGDPFDRKMCHKTVSDSNLTLGTFGNYHCDAPWALVEHAIAGMAKIDPNPDFIIWTGDDGPHVPASELNTQKVLRIISDVTNALLRYFPTTKFFPVLGNHDYYPTGAMPPEPNTIYEEVGNFWSNSSSHWLGSKETALFKKYGYYSSVYTPSGSKAQPIRMLGLNTVYYYTQDKLTGNISDPGGQLEWAESECTSARKNGEKVFVIGHVPPGVFERLRNYSWFYPQFNSKFIDFLKRNADVISGRFFAHEHSDTFRVIQEAGDLASVLFLAPAVTPWNTSLPGVGPNNPGIRLYDYDTETGEVIDIRQYWLNLTEANAENQSEWKLEYQATKVYGIHNVSGSCMVGLAEKFVNDGDEGFEKYYGFNSVSYDWSCDSACKTAQICSILCVDYANYDACVKSSNDVEKICLGKTGAATVIPLYGKILIGMGGGLIVITIILVITVATRKKREASFKVDSTEPLLGSAGEP